MILSLLKKNYIYLLFFLIAIIGFYLRFHAINLTQEFGWDQARDAWKVRDLLNGHLVLDGPKTGTGGMHIGPLYFYLLAPFYFLTRLDPAASNYFSMTAYMINIGIFFFITRRLFSNTFALTSTLFYVFSFYLIRQSQIPWNVTLVPGISLMIFYSIYKIYQKKYYFFPLLALLTGFFSHLHFTYIFLPPIILISLLRFKDWKKAGKYIVMSIPIFLIFFIPTLFFNFSSNNMEASLLKNFNNYYIQNFHFRFFLYRLPQSLTQFNALLFPLQFAFLKYLIPLMFFLILFFEKDRHKKQLSYLMLPWFIVPPIAFTFYKGEVSDYYFLFHMPLVIYMLFYLQQKLLIFQKPILLPLLLLFWSWYGYENVKATLNLPKNKGIDIQRENAKKQIKENGAIQFNEGDIKAYFYQIWKDRNEPL